MNIIGRINNVNSLQLFQLFRFSAAIILGILLVKSGYSQAEVGLYELFFFIGNAVSFFWVMGFRNAYLSYFPKMDANGKKVLIFNLALLMLVLGIITSSLLFMGKDLIAGMLNDHTSIPNCDLICIYIIFITPTVLTEITFLLLKKNKEIVLYGTFTFGAQLLLVGSIIIMGFEIRTMLSALVIWAMLRFGYLLIVIIQNGKWKINTGLIKKFAWFGLPLVGHILLGSGMEFVDGFLVTYYFDENDFAIFRYGARELPLTTILIGALSSAMIPILVDKGQSELKIVKAKANRLMNILYPISIGLILLAPVLFPIIYAPDYKLSAYVFNIYLLIITSRILLTQVVLFANHKNNVLLVMAFIETILNVSLSLIFMQYWGLMGIAAATVVAYLLNKAMMLIYNYYIFGIGFNNYISIKKYLIFNAILIASFFISMQY